MQALRAGLIFLAGSIEVRVIESLLVQLFNACCRVFAQLVKISELNRFCRAGFRARWLHVFTEPVIAQRAFPGSPILFTPVDHSERTVHDAISASIANVG